MEKQKEYNLRYLLAKVRTTWEKKRRTGSDSGRTNATKTVSDVFRHRSRTGKSYCRTRSDVGSERVNGWRVVDSFVRSSAETTECWMACPNVTEEENFTAQSRLSHDALKVMHGTSSGEIDLFLLITCQLVRRSVANITAHSCTCEIKISG
jgi:hypothetical protein